ncbi:conserved hypothetical protein [Talaromyces stipitatus ATCC 10500]|uniref:Uncharacterized protein n=1 Tax=Talaromyces stipitatus (strain ATCC 10500 / CBS 375.48 / QM 6759 / NRRL 1006) TaxID=441959 RepID=B8MQ26_TALSN|nr:uncharacterized protein TSTA_055540 [Talaromyces stipitatus ATCC 10500]EED13052.1 conserved hypothetical protein [Talaromyces stipitatus ATCC 10500]
MPRLLPWLTKDDLRGKRDRSTPTPVAEVQPSTRRRTGVGLRTPSPGVSSNNGGDRSGKQKSGQNTTNIDFLRSSRSPPTSPIASPPTEEYIIPGFDNDDMYIMVEDEFYAIAQQFTRHLHHAEYIRRKKQAKKLNASVLRNMERPTDGKTAMSKRMLKRKEAERLRERQKKGLEPMSRRPDNDSDTDGDGGLEEIGDEEEECEDDPWYGTSLHAFMTSPRKNKSLVGLERIRSKTRAAAGFESEVTARPPTSNSSRPGSSLWREDAQSAGNDELQATSSGDDDDLEIVEAKSSRPNPLPESKVRVRTNTVKKESPEVGNIRPKTQQNTVKRREVAFENQRTSTTTLHPQHAVIKQKHVHAKDLKSEFKKETFTTSTKPSTLNRPRKRIFLDELDDTDVKTNDTSRNDDIIQDQPRKLLSTTAAKESRSTYRTTSEQKQQDKTAKRSRISDIPMFLV